MKDYCKQCGRKLKNDEIALNKKLIHPELESFLCLTCLSERFKLDEEKLNEKIAYFKRIGCTLFYM